MLFCIGMYVCNMCWSLWEHIKVRDDTKTLSVINIIIGFFLLTCFVQAFVWSNEALVNEVWLSQNLKKIKKTVLRIKLINRNE